MAVPIPNIYSPSDDKSPVKRIIDATKRESFSSETQYSETDLLKIEKHIKIILNECELQSIHDTFQIAYILATARFESRLGIIMTEPISPEDAIAKYSNHLGNETKKDAELYISRGYVGLKGKAAYYRMGIELSENLLANPELASEPEIAAQIITIGMKEGLISYKAKLSDYIQGPDHDFISARNIVYPPDLTDALDKAKLIAKYAESYSKVLH